MKASPTESSEITPSCNYALARVDNYPRAHERPDQMARYFYVTATIPYFA